MSTAFRVFFRLVVAALFLTTSVQAQSEAAERRAAIEGIYPIMLGALQAKNYGRARNICEQVILWEPQNPVHHYNLACIDAQAGGARLPYAWGSLELAVALGFDDANHFQNDPDLAPLRDDPRFAQLVNKMVYNQSAQSAIESIKFPAAGKPALAPGSEQTEQDQPAAAGIVDGVPVGLFLMTQYLPTSLTLERSVWYFAPDRQVLRDLEHGFSQADLSKHAGARGKLGSSGEQLSITWSDGTTMTGDMEREGDGFTWDMRIFEPVTSFAEADDVPGVYEGSEPADLSMKEMPVPQRLHLGADGTFRWEGVKIADEAGKPRQTAAPNALTTGRWALSGFSLILTTSEGIEWRRIAFPQDDQATIIRPDHMYFGGLLYKRRP